MTQSKFTKLLNEYLSKLGDVDVVKFIDYYYRETYEGCLGWKVREVMKLSDLINAGVTPVTEIGVNWNGRDLLKFLSKYERPYEVRVKYPDSYERYLKQKEENKDREQAKIRAIEQASGIFMQPYYNFHNLDIF